MLVASLLSLEAAAVEIAPEAEAELAELLDDADAFASELLRAAGGAAIDEVVRAGNEALDPPELPDGDAAYVEMWDRVAADWRDDNSFQPVADNEANLAAIAARLGVAL